MGSDSVHKTRNNSGSLWSVFRSCVAVAGVVLLLIVTRPPPATPADKREAVAHHRKLIADEKDGAVTLVDEDAPPALLGKSEEPPMARGLYRFTAEDIDGQPRSLSTYAGLVSIVVNVASACGYTASNYAGLQKLYEEFGPQGFTVLAFPCNAFSNQEPGTNEEIKAFAEKSGATFPLFAKIDAVNGADASPIYAWLHAQPGGEEDVEWNFVKYLISSHGHVLQRYGPAFDGAALRADILDALKEAHEEADAMRHQHR